MTIEIASGVSSFDEWCERIAAQPHNVGLQEEFIVEYSKGIETVARRAGRAKRLPTAAYPDLHQEVLLIAVTEMREFAADPELRTRVHGGDFIGWLYGKALNAAQRVVRGEHLGGLTDAGAVHKRVLSARKVQADLRISLGREPTDSEVIVEHHRRIDAQPSGARRQAEKIGREDLHGGAAQITYVGADASQVGSFYTDVPGADDADELAFPWLGDVNAGKGFLADLVDCAHEILDPPDAQIIEAAMSNCVDASGKTLCPESLTPREVHAFMNPGGRRSVRLADITRVCAMLPDLAMETLRRYVHAHPDYERLYRSIRPPDV